jgi:hypothetical protein
VEFHGPGRAGLDAQTASHAAIVIESHLTRHGVQYECMSGANTDAGAALSAPCFIAQDAVAQGFDFDSRRRYVFNACVVLVLFPAEFEHDVPFLVRYDRSLQNVKAQIVIFYQVIDKRLLYDARREMQYYSS